MGSGGGGDDSRIGNQLNRMGDWINTQLGVTEGSLGDAINRGNPALESNMRNLGGEISGANSERQRNWQNQVASNAEAQRLKELADKQLEAQNADVAASRAAQKSRVGPGSRAPNFNWQDPSGADITDFLGL